MNGEWETVEETVFQISESDLVSASCMCSSLPACAKLVKQHRHKRGEMGLEHKNLHMPTFVNAASPLFQSLCLLRV